MSEKIKVLLVEPDKQAVVTEIENDLSTLQETVGGMIEAYYPFSDEVAIICNDEGKINGMPLNRAIYDEDGEMMDIIAGTFIVAGLTEEDFGSLSDEMCQKYWQRFQFPEKFASVDGEIVAIKHCNF